MSTPPLPGPTKAVRIARTKKPLPQTRPNFIPRQSWLDYNWKDKDPELEFVQWAIADSGMSAEKIEAETAAIGHKVSRYTIIGWMYKGVKRPQNATIQTVMSVLGWDRPWIRRSTGMAAHARTVQPFKKKLQKV